MSDDLNGQIKNIEIHPAELAKSKLIRDIFGIEDTKESIKNPLNTIIFLDSKIVNQNNNDKKTSLINKVSLSSSTTNKTVLKKLPKKITYYSNDMPKQENPIISDTEPAIKKDNLYGLIKNIVTTSDLSTFANNQSKSKNKIENNSLNYIPCMNCNEMINIDKIDQHTNSCLIVKEEVNQAEESKYTYHLIDFKLKKLQSHIIQIYDNNKLSNDSHYLHILTQTMKDSIEVAKISALSLSSLKKYSINLDVRFN